MPDGMKVCNRCAVERPLDEFHRRKNRTGGRTAICIPCLKAAYAARPVIEPVSDGEKPCANCKVVKPMTDFPRHRKGLQGRHTECKECSRRRRALYRLGPMGEVVKEQSRLRAFARYQLTEQDYKDLLTAQGGVCAICRRTPEETGKRLRVDHDQTCCPPKHRTTCGKCTRGLLCDMCNRGLGYFGDRSKTMAVALKYLVDAEQRLALLKEGQ